MKPNGHQEMLKAIAALPEVQRTIICPNCGHQSSLSKVAVELEFGSYPGETLDQLLHGDWQCDQCGTEYICGVTPTVYNVVRSASFTREVNTRVFLANDLAWDELTAFRQQIIKNLRPAIANLP